MRLEAASQVGVVMRLTAVIGLGVPAGLVMAVMPPTGHGIVVVEGLNIQSGIHFLLTYPRFGV